MGGLKSPAFGGPFPGVVSAGVLGASPFGEPKSTALGGPFPGVVSAGALGAEVPGFAPGATGTGSTLGKVGIFGGNISIGKADRLVKELSPLTRSFLSSRIATYDLSKGVSISRFLYLPGKAFSPRNRRP